MREEDVLHFDRAGTSGPPRIMPRIDRANFELTMKACVKAIKKLRTVLMKLSVMRVFFIGILFIITISSYEYSIAADLPLHPFTYVQDFETEDPFQLWTSNGSYTVHYKGLTSERASSGKKSFKLDVTLGTATYLYWKIPVKIPSEGKLEFHGDIYLKRVEGIVSASLGTNISLSPCPHSGVNVIKRINAPSTNWVTQTSDLSAVSTPNAEKLLTKYCGGARVEDVGKWTDILGIFIYARDGGRITLYVDNISVEGNIPNVSDYSTEANKAWQSYLNRIKSDINELHKTVIQHSTRFIDQASNDYVKDCHLFVDELNIKVDKGHYPSGEEYIHLKNIVSDLNYLDDYNSVIRTQSNASFTIFPWDPITSKKILPDTFPIPASPGKEISIKACRGEFEPASFVIRARKNLKTVTIKTSDLVSKNGETIPAGALDIRLVKCWYQAGDGTIRNQSKKCLQPELLLKDDSLIKIDYINKKNYLKVILQGVEKYIDISSPESTFPDDAVFKDAKRLQPFDMAADTNKQVWITLHVPESATPGDYRGNITVDADGKFSTTVELVVKVLPFSLEEPPLEVSIYYRGKLFDKPKQGINSEWKTEEQYLAELVDMRDHGVTNPTIYQPLNNSLVKKALDLRKRAGLKNDNLYVLGTTTGNPTDFKGLSVLKERVKRWINLARPFGYKDVFIYGIDEARDEKLVSQKKAWEAVHSVGGKVFVACSLGAADTVGDLLDRPILSGKFKETEVNKWHSFNKKVYIYGNPQVGVEDPEIYRKNYGFALFCAGYDGIMDYAYQHSFGHIWNDFDDDTYRDHVFAYPTSGGVIDTIEWEGFREGVDDLRYLAVLKKKKGYSLEFIKKWLSEILLDSKSLYDVRMAIVEAILSNGQRGSELSLPAPQALRLITP